MRVLFIGHSYHQSTRSSGFFAEILESIGDVEYVWDSSWMPGGASPNIGELEKYDLVVIWQLPHIATKVPVAVRVKCVYVPMHDAVAGLRGKFWRSLRGMRVICFSVQDYVTAIRNRVESIYWQYYPLNQPSYKAVSFDNLRLFFWQRRQRPNWRTLVKKIPMTQFESVHLHEALDPSLGAFTQPHDTEVRAFKITKTKWFDDTNEYIKTLSQHNVFVAPRALEGIGMALLEALGAGMVCIANAAPTMNEYIVDKLNGFLIDFEEEGEIVDISDPKHISENAKHYFCKGAANSEKMIPSIVAYLQQSSAPAFESVLTPIKEKTKALSRKIKKINGLADLKLMSERYAMRNAGVARPLISIVTVTKNNKLGLIETMRSVFEQTYLNTEFIVVDGGSEDSSIDVIKQCEAGIDYFKSGPDNGPYDAMNKSLNYCRGKYVVFMNSGDKFFKNHSLDFAMQDAPNSADIIYGHHFYVTAAHKMNPNAARYLTCTYEELVEGRLDAKWLSGIPCHQSTLTSVELLRSHPYDWHSFKVAADHDFLFARMADRVSSYNTNTYISKYYGGGLSAKLQNICTQNWREIALKYCNYPEKVYEFYGRSF